MSTIPVKFSIGIKPVHTSERLLMRPNALNAHRHDHIGWKWDKEQKLLLKNLQNINLPASFSWACGWYVRVGSKDFCKISN